MKFKTFAILLIFIPISISSQDISLLLPGTSKQNNTNDSLYILSNKAYTIFLKTSVSYLICKKTDSLQKAEIANRKEINFICDSALKLSQKESKLWYDSLIFYDNKLKTCEVDLVNTKNCRRNLLITSAITTLAAITLAILYVLK